MPASHGFAPEPTEPLVAALEHPMRSRILAVLTDRVASAGDVADAIGEPVSKVRYHIRALAKSGLIGLKEATDRRGAREKRWIARTPQVMHEDQLRRLSPEQVRSAMLYYMRLLFADATAALRAGAFDHRTDNFVVRFRPQVDEQGWNELVAVFYRAMAEIAMVADRSSERLAESDEDPLVIAASLMLFRMAGSASAIPGALPPLDEF